MLGFSGIARRTTHGFLPAGLRHAFSPANLLTLIRLPLAGILWLRPDEPRWLMTIVAIAAISDVVDGRIARAIRRRNPQRYSGEDAAVGAWLDPLCDKLFAISALAALWLGLDASPAVIALAATREIIIAPLVALYLIVPVLRKTLHFDFRADWLGKLTTVFQFAVAGAIALVPPAAWPLALTTSAVGLWAAIHYVRRGIRQARLNARQPDFLRSARSSHG